ncbi:unnamed protein product [Medioppia subpectinata]|uniref:Dehydrogenase/reductase SDR family member 4 n=1 Tax=Medioppia subpectinata TaxID=1979941 RepID=A0A7R9KMU4_9ACAR|nr:unnamed protein product [Medioppia subpectinata]CAG2106181.1 unnamed protein product [Medioppia subpectinata]
MFRNLKTLLVTNNRRIMSTTSGQKRLADKVAIVTASTDGIGLAIATRLAEDGARVVVSSRKEANVEKTVRSLRAKGLQVTGVVCHVGNREHRQRLLQTTLREFGQVDVLVSNAAVNPAFGAFLDVSHDNHVIPSNAFSLSDFGRGVRKSKKSPKPRPHTHCCVQILSVNVTSAFLLTKEIVPEMRAYGSIVYISSIGAYQPFPLIGAYSVSKTALLGLTKAVANQCAALSIRANCICPGIIRTKFSDALTGSEAAMEEIERVVPMQRIGAPEDIAGIVAFLASDDSRYLTGESIVVAGGHYSRL